MRCATGKPLKRKLTLEVVKEGMTRGSFYRQAQAPAAFQAGRPRAHQEHAPADAHPPAALCARACRAWSSWCTAATRFRTRWRIDQGDNPQWLYTVVFDSRELWGPDADPTIKISIDAFEPYLEPA